MTIHDYKLIIDSINFLVYKCLNCNLIKNQAKHDMTYIYFFDDIDYIVYVDEPNCDELLVKGIIE